MNDSYIGYVYKNGKQEIKVSIYSQEDFNIFVESHFFDEEVKIKDNKKKLIYHSKNGHILIPKI